MQCTCSNVMTFSNPDQHSYIVYSGRSDVYRVTESRHKDVAHQLLYERLHIRHTVICLINQLGLLAQADSLQCQRILSHASSPFTTLHPPTQQSHDSVLIPTPFQRLNILTSCSFVLSSIFLSGARCRLAYDPADATATHCLLLCSKIQIGFTFLVPAHPGSRGQRAVKRVCVCCVNCHASVLWHCWLGGRKGIWPVKNYWKWWSACMVICLEWGADLHMAQLMPLPLTVSCFRKIQIGFTFLVPAHPGNTGQRAVKGCVCVFSHQDIYIWWHKIILY